MRVWPPWLSCTQVSLWLYPEPEERAQAVGEKPRKICVWRKHPKMKIVFLSSCAWLAVMALWLCVNWCVEELLCWHLWDSAIQSWKHLRVRRETRTLGEAGPRPGVRPAGCHTQVCTDWGSWESDTVVLSLCPQRWGKDDGDRPQSVVWGCSKMKRVS